MSKKTINFGDKEINKKDFYNKKKQFNIKDIDTNKIIYKKYEKNTLLDIKITLSFHYNYFYQK